MDIDMDEDIRNYANSNAPTLRTISNKLWTFCPEVIPPVMAVIITVN